MTDQDYADLVLTELRARARMEQAPGDPECEVAWIAASRAHSQALRQRQDEAHARYMGTIERQNPPVHFERTEDILLEDR